MAFYNIVMNDVAKSKGRIYGIVAFTMKINIFKLLSYYTLLDGTGTLIYKWLSFSWIPLGTKVSFRNYRIKNHVIHKILSNKLLCSRDFQKRSFILKLLYIAINILYMINIEKKKFVSLLGFEPQISRYLQVVKSSYI